MISYEVSIGFILVCVVLWAGSFNLPAIVESQRGYYGFLNGNGFNPLLFPMSILLLVSAMAETGRAPLDLTEAELEMVPGSPTETSSMTCAVFWPAASETVFLISGRNDI